MAMRKMHWARAAKFGVFGIVAVTLFSALVMVLWNWLMPGLFGWRAITLWQALGLLVLSRILFGRLGGPGGRGRWRDRMVDRWLQMTPEEREKFVEGMRAAGRHGPRAADSTT
jgi:hypothetical protein